MATLQEAIKAVKSIRTYSRAGKTSIANKLLGKFDGIIPAGKTSTQFIKELRKNLYGKTSN